MPPRSRRVKLNDDDLATESGLSLLRLLENITADGTITKDEVRELARWLNDSGATSAVPGLHCLREEVMGILADQRVTEAEIRVLRDSILRVLPAKARDQAKERFFNARQQATIARELAQGYDRTQPQPATEAQREYVRVLGGTLAPDASVADASELIEALLQSSPTPRQRMVLRFWHRDDLLTAGVEGVSAWMDQWYAEDPDRLEAWKLWKLEHPAAGGHSRELVDLVPTGAGVAYLARVKRAQDAAADDGGDGPASLGSGFRSPAAPTGRGSFMATASAGASARRGLHVAIAIGSVLLFLAFVGWCGGAR